MRCKYPYACTWQTVQLLVFSEKTLLHSTEYGPGAAGLAWRQAVSGGGVDNILVLCCTRGCVGDDVWQCVVRVCGCGSVFVSSMRS